MLTIIAMVVALAALWVAFTRVFRNAGHMTVTCPRQNCRQRVKLTQLACANCGNTGKIKRIQIGRSGGGGAFSKGEYQFSCTSCKHAAIPQCPHCGTALHGMFGG
jgi:hypothetical protein